LTALRVVFEGVEFLRLRRAYSGLTLARVGPEQSEAGQSVLALPLPLLHLRLADEADTGFVTCSRVSIRRDAAEESGEPEPTGDLLFQLVAGSTP
jgi:hypothetical protein